MDAKTNKNTFRIIAIARTPLNHDVVRWYIVSSEARIFFSVSYNKYNFK